MKKQVPAFLAGVLTAVLAFSLGTAALAMTGAVGTVEFNTVGLIQGEEQVFCRGEDYLLDNGNLVPTSILFTDATGGSTTYLPVRRMAQLFGTEIIWNGPDGNIEIVNP